MTSLNFRPALTLTFDELAAAFNESFAGYFYPQQTNGASFARRTRLEQFDLEHSLLAFDGETFVGLALLGVRGNRGWCGGFGIVPDRRGRGHAGELMTALLAEAKDCGLKHLSLEVLSRNTPAIRLYERAGMRVTRELLILERAAIVNEVNEPDEPNQWNETEPATLLRHFHRLHQTANAWQRDLPTLLITEGARGFCLGESTAPSAYVIAVTWSEGRTHLIDLAATDAEQAEALSARLSQIPDVVRIVNEPEESIFVSALIKHGFVEIDRQLEMHCEL
jgi:RimJ/RimL family protein N-acetyltransferase